MNELLVVLTYSLPLLLFVLLWQRRQQRMHVASVAARDSAVAKSSSILFKN